MLREVAVILRTLRRHRTFTLATIGTLALGIAAPTALFTTINAVLLRPLPYPAAQDIYAVRTRITDGRYTSGLAAPAELGGLQQASDRVLHATGAAPLDLTLLTESGPIKATGYGVWRDFFDLFGLPMTLGRGFGEDEHAARAPASIVLSHRLWRTTFGADPDIVGKSIRMPDMSLLVVGVAGADFDEPAQSDFWVNLRINPENIGHLLYGYIRLRPGTSLEALEPAMTQVMQDLAVKYPDQNKNRVFVLTPLLDSVVGDLGPILVIVFAATGLLLALACVNVTNLSIARGTVRARELAIRSALGASRGRLARYALLESLLLAAVGGTLGLAIAYGGLRLLLATGASQLARLDQVTFDPAVLLFAAGTIAATGILVGVAPALRPGEMGTTALMNEGGRGGTGSRRTRRVLAALVAVEIAVGVALLAGTGRMVASYANLRASDPGFTQDDRLIVDLLLPNAYRDPARHEAWFAQVTDRIRALGATDVAAASSLPLRAEWDTTTFVDLVNAPTTDPHQRPNGRLRIVSAGFFETMGIRLVAGRTFTSRDTQNGAPVAIVNEALARRFFGGRDPLRERLMVPGVMRMANGRPVPAEIAVVGVVADVRYAGLHIPAEQTVYLSDAQRPWLRKSLVIATSGPRPERLVPAITAALQSLDPQVALGFDMMSRVRDASLGRQRLGMILMVLFGVAALVLITVGVFGVTAYAVGQRMGEMAVRSAMGATRRQLLWSVAGHNLRLLAIGLAAGFVLTWWTGTLIASYVYEVRAVEPVVIGSVVLTMLALAAVATIIPARRAAAVDPSLALRSG